MKSLRRQELLKTLQLVLVYNLIIWTHKRFHRTLALIVPF